MASRGIRWGVSHLLLSTEARRDSKWDALRRKWDKGCRKWDKARERKLSRFISTCV